MKKTMLKIAVAAAFAAPFAAQATIFQYQATLTGAKEVPPVSSTATGFAIMFYNDRDTAGDLSDDVFSIITSASGLSSVPTNAHIHGPAAADQTASPIVNLWSTNPNATNFVTANSFFGNLTDVAPTGTFTSTAQPSPARTLLETLNDGLAYVNVHTDLFGGGEVRGQLALVPTIPEPETYALMLAGLGLVGWVASRRRKVGV